LLTKTAWLIDGVAPPTLKEPLREDWSSLVVTLGLNSQHQQVNVDCYSGVIHYQKVVLFPSLVEPWIPQQWRRNRRLPPVAEGCSGRDFGYNLVIEGVEPGALLYPLPGHKAEIELELKAIGATGQVYWFVDGRWAVTDAAQHTVQLAISGVGEHRIHAMDDTGRQQEVIFLLLD
jgi:penicillin-binding protein 1C